MCGIAGLLGLRGRAIDPGLAARMGAALVHRGPDDEGYAIVLPDGTNRSARRPEAFPSGACRLAFAHRRLSILDLSDAAHQPMIDERGRILVYNGEIYNFVELRDDLAREGARFRSTGDTEVLLTAYDHWGTSCVERFNGMWSFAIWDPVEAKLFCSRDRFGVKPFYFATGEDSFAFASEIKALREIERRPADRETCLRYLAFDEFDVGERTFFEGVRQLLPGHSLLLEPGSGRLDIRRYWRLSARPQMRPERPAEAVRSMLADSVRLRLRSDVPVGTCLSGGLDSSTLVALVSRVDEAELHTFSALFSEPGLDEERYVRAILGRVRARGWEVRPDAASFAREFDRLIHYQDEPVRAPGAYPQWEVMKLARGRVKVLLDGQGADEVFAGYLYFFPAYLRSLFGDGLAGKMRSIGVLPSLLSLAIANRRVLSTYRPGLALRRILFGRGVSTAGQVLRRVAADGVRPTPLEPPDATDPLARRLILSITRTSLPALLHYEDRSSMAHSIEARTPYLDYRLVELALTFATPDRIDGARTKAALRSAARPLLPRSIHDRRDKLGFPTPFDRWCRGPSAAFVAERVLGPSAADDLLDPPAIGRIWRDHRAGRANWGSLLWKILAFRTWLSSAT